jgi:hypothetical protein
MEALPIFQVRFILSLLVCFVHASPLPDAHLKSQPSHKHTSRKVSAQVNKKLESKKVPKKSSFPQPSPGPNDMIQWPLRLFENAADYDYMNDTIQTPLYEAYSSIFDIVTGHEPHPIVELFAAHMAQERTEFFEDNPNGHLTTNNLLEAASHFPFTIPILPGDTSLVDEFLASLMHHVKDQPINDCAIEGISQALFKLVILRTYLGRPPENDLNIFEAVKNGQITRLWTSHELALAARYGEEDASLDAVFDMTPNPDLWKIKVIRDSTLELTEEHPFVAIKRPITWTNRPGLTGGSLKPRHYKPPYLRDLALGPRPKPRPAYGTRFASDDGTSVGATAATSACQEVRRGTRQRKGVKF